MNFKKNNGHIVNPLVTNFNQASTSLSNINRLQLISSHATQWHEKKPKIFSFHAMTLSEKINHQVTVKNNYQLISHFIP